MKERRIYDSKRVVDFTYLSSMNHERYMERCLQLAKIGLADAAPNPSVGAVLIHENRIIGEGYTSPFGGDHGEVNCIKNAKRNGRTIPKNTTLYVSLEPCSHFGQTPPCSDLIIKEGISTVVVACSDPNPLVAGKGIQKLKEAGVKIIKNVCKTEALKLNKRFFTFHEKNRPYIILKWAQSQQGFFAPETGEQFWITHPKTKALVHFWRSQEMAILVGDKTVVNDNPKLNTRLVSGKNPIRVVINTNEELNQSHKLISDDLPSIVFSFKAIESIANKEYILLDQAESIIPQILEELYSRKINSVIIEGGAYTLNQFIQSKTWDEARILTGQKELNKGILAPVIEGEIQEEFEFTGDQIKILKNKL